MQGEPAAPSMSGSCGVPESPRVAVQTALDSFTVPAGQALMRAETSSDVCVLEIGPREASHCPETPPPKAA